MEHVFPLMLLLQRRHNQRSDLLLRVLVNLIVERLLLEINPGRCVHLLDHLRGVLGLNCVAGDPGKGCLI